MVSIEADRLAELKAFDETKAGVKGLVNAGISTIPSIFIHPQNDHQVLSLSGDSTNNMNVPIIDLTGVWNDADRRKDIVDEIRDAAEKWGFFQVVNHGITVTVMDEMLEGIRRFFEQDEEVKKIFYSRDYGKHVAYNSNYDLYSGSPVNWRDTIRCRMAPDPPNPEDLPTSFRDIITKNSKQVMNLGKMLFELISEALGLQTSHLNHMGCSEGLTMMGHYYPPCPQPHLTIGTAEHSDADFMTVLLQDQVGGLQILLDNHWVEVPPTHGALVVNIGDFLQLLSNDKSKSAIHRVVANRSKVPRISVAGFFRNPFELGSKKYKPIEQLISEDNPPRYRETTMKELYAHSQKTGLSDISSLKPFRL